MIFQIFSFCSFVNLNENNVFFLPDLPETRVNMIKLVSKSTFSVVLLYGTQFKGVKQISFLTPVVTVWRHFFLTCTYIIPKFQHFQKNAKYLNSVGQSNHAQAVLLMSYRRALYNFKTIE